MAQNSSGRRLFAIIIWWFLASIVGLTVALVAVGYLGLWVAVGAIAGLGATVVTGFLCQFLFATDMDAMIEAKRAKGETRGDLS